MCVLKDAFFGILNELVVGGQVMELFDKEEEETLLDLLSDELRKGKPEGHSLTIAELREKFIKVCKPVQYNGRCFILFAV